MLSTTIPQNRSLTPPLRPDSRHDGNFESLDDVEKRHTAWQYHGYPELSKWMASSNDFFVLRKFSVVGARSLLFLQNEIAQREKKLEGWDLWTMKFPNGQGGCGSFKFDEGSQRAELLNEMITLLERYYNLVISFAEVRARPTAFSHHRTNLEKWFNTYPNAIQDEEKHFMDPSRERDIFAIVSRDSPYTQYHSDTAFDISTGIIIVVVGLCLLFGPLWWLNFVAKDVFRLGIITGSVTVFAAWLWMAAGTRPFEILAGTAAYAAVLIVYLQIQHSDSSTAEKS